MRCDLGVIFGGFGAGAGRALIAGTRGDRDGLGGVALPERAGLVGTGRRGEMGRRGEAGRRDGARDR